MFCAIPAEWRSRTWTGGAPAPAAVHRSGRLAVLRVQRGDARGARTHAAAFDGMAAAVSFEEGAARIVRTWKDAGERRLASEMARLMLPQVPPAWLAGATATPIPASAAARRRARLRPRPGELACAVAGMAGIPMSRRWRGPAPSTSARSDGAGAFTTCRGASRRCRRHGARPHPAHRRCLHHGSTMNAACDALRAAGAVELHCLVFARV